MQLCSEVFAITMSSKDMLPLCISTFSCTYSIYAVRSLLWGGTVALPLTMDSCHGTNTGAAKFNRRQVEVVQDLVIGGMCRLVVRDATVGGA